MSFDPEAVVGFVGAHPAVRAIRLAGSRAAGSEVGLSDWDFAVEAEDFAALAEALPQLVEPLAPLARQWDRLSGHPTYMLMLRGPVKVDFLFLGLPNEQAAPWVAEPETLAGIDAHFWDWIIWIASKREHGLDAVVAEHLALLHEHVLKPMGVERAPESTESAARAYAGAREELERRFSIAVDRELGDEVAGALRRSALKV